MSTPADKVPEYVYRGRRFNVRTVAWPSHHGQKREAVVAPHAAVVLPLLDEQTIVLIRNERFAVGQTLWELPAGTLEDHEQPRLCASRELTEETGYRARRIEPLVDFYPSPGICTERMYSFLATGLDHVGQNLEDHERITVEAVDLNRSMQMVQDNTIQDGKTIAVLLYYVTFLKKKPS